MVIEELEIVVDERGAVTVKRRIDEIGKAAKGAEGSVHILRRALGLLGKVLDPGDFVRYLDTATALENRLKAVTSGTEELAAVQERLFGVAQRTRSTYEGMVESFARLAPAANELGASQQELLRFTESLTQAVKLSGASGEDAEAAVNQLSQAVASGGLGGGALGLVDELPVVADVLAQSLDVTRGELRALGAEGKVTADVVINAFAAARQELDERFGQTTTTLGERFVQLENSTIRFFGELDNAIGITEKLGAAINFLTENLSIVAAALAAAFGPTIMAPVVAQLAALGAAILSVARAVTLSVALVGPIGAMRAAFSSMATTVLSFVAAHPFAVTAVGAVALAAALAQLTPALDDLTKDFEEVAHTALASVSPAFKAMRTDIEDTNEHFRSLINATSAPEFQGTDVELKEIAGSFLELSLRAATAGESVDDYRVKLERSKGGLDEVHVALVRVHAILDDSAKNYEEAAKAIDRGNQFHAKLLAVGDEQTRRVEKARREYQSLVEGIESFRAALDPVVAAQFDLRDAEELLNRARKNGLISLQDQIKLLGAFKDAQLDALSNEDAFRLRLERGEVGVVEQVGVEQSRELFRNQPTLGLGDDFESVAESSKAFLEQDAAAASEQRFDQALAEASKQARALQAEQPGLSSALKTIREDMTNVGGAVESTLVNAFNSAEDALVKFVQTGKFEFSSLVDSILADLTRLLTRQLFTSLLGAFGGAFGGGGGGVDPDTLLKPTFRRSGGGFTTLGSGSPDASVLAMRVTPGEGIIAFPANQQTQPSAPQQQAPVVNVGVALSPDDVRSAMAGEQGQRIIINAIASNPNLIRNVTGSG